MFILAHHLLASVRSNADPEEVLRRFYATTILTVHTTNYTPGQFLGAYFNIAEHVTNHPNWLNSRFEKIFNPVIGQALAQRPTLAKTRLIPPRYETPETINPC